MTELLMGTARSVWILCSTAVLMYLAQPALASGACLRSPEEVATTFVTRSVEDAQSTTELIQPDNLKVFRSRLQQVMDDRYSADSAAFRQRWLGSEWSQERISRASDKELVGKYFVGDGRRQLSTRISEVLAVESRPVPFADREIVVAYVIEEAARKTAGRQEFSANQSGDCWFVQLTTEAWGRLEEVAAILKKSRKQVLIPRQGSSRIKLQVAAASSSEEAGMQRMPGVDDATEVWVASTPLLTQNDVVGAAAAWDCDTGGWGAEEAAVSLTFSSKGADALIRWSEVNIDSMLAVVLDSQVVTVARVASVLGPRLSFCLPGKSLEEAQVIAADLVGARQ